MPAQKIRFVTDSTCDLPADIVQKYRIGVIPTFINHSNQSFADNGRDFRREDFYQQLPHLNPLPTTSAMPPALAEDVIMDTFADADHLFLISVASKLSGVYNIMLLCANKLRPVLVSRIYSGWVWVGLGFRVVGGADAAEATGDVAQVQAAF
jgi:DegV family protein with EDD domain